MQTKVNYAIVGLFVVILFIATVTIGSWLSFGLKSQPYRMYVTYMNESVAGLEGQALVKYNGVDVGYVSSIQLNNLNPQQVMISMKIKEDAPIFADTKATLMEQGLTGIAYIELRGGNTHLPLKVTPGQTYPVIKSAPSFFLQLDTTVQSLSNNIQSLTASLQDLLDKQNLKSIKQSLNNIDQITANLAANNQRIDESIKSLNVLLANSAAASKNIPQVLNGLQKASNNINKTMQQGNIAIQTFSNQLLPKAYNTLQGIQNVSGHLQGLSNELENNPAAIIQGTSPRADGPGER